jgi:hypothetical protein
MEYVALACRCVIGTVFLVAAASKLRSRSSREAFLIAVSALAPGGRSAPLGFVVIGVELAAVVLIGLPATAVPGLALAAGTLVAFSTALWRAPPRTPVAWWSASPPRW